MATKFLEPGGDATFNAATTTAGGFWSSATGTVVSDFVHGNHLRSYKLAPNSSQQFISPASVCADAGTRISFYLYLNALPTTSTATIVLVENVANVMRIRITTAGVLQLWSDTVQLGTNGSTLTTGIWYRISLSFTVTSTSVNRFEQFTNGVSSISLTNASLSSSGASTLQFGNFSTNVALDFRVSDIYVDNSSALTDPGNIWVTAKRPNANGTTNGFTTQIGSGGSGYGTGHSPQVNERPLSTTNGWSMVGAGAAITEEYNIESISVGDINIATATIVDYIGWAYMSSLVSETVQVILNGVSVAQAITSTNTMYTKVAGSATYPAGTGTDIGIQTDTSLTTVSLFECGIMVAYIPSTATYVRDMLGMFQ